MRGTGASRRKRWKSRNQTFSQSENKVKFLVLSHVGHLQQIFQQTFPPRSTKQTLIETLYNMNLSLVGRSSLHIGCKDIFYRQEFSKMAKLDFENQQGKESPYF